MAKRDDPIDALFRLPLAEFIGARKELAARLKKTGYTDEVENVKALTKPSISAWTVNQLYWNNRDEFDELISTGQRFRKAQTSGKMVNMREALDARREALVHLSDLAAEILGDAGHNPSLDILRRITTTLEALSSLASFSDDTTPGRLTHDIDPPGFDSFGVFTPSAVTTSRAPNDRGSSPTVREGVQANRSLKKSVTAPSKSQPKATADAERDQETRQAKITAAKASLQNAKKALAATQAQKKSLEAAQKRAEAAAKEAEKQKFHAEERLKRASAASTEAAERVESIAAELAEATEAVEDANRAVESATRNLETSFRDLR
jgi:DNA repair exonuclease SbcCD ATPase subunit